jgi:hypothetical protein
MRSTKPFTLAQRQSAIKVYHSLRVHLGTIRFQFPPRDAHEHAMLHDLKIAVRDLARALRVQRGKVDVDRLNVLEVRASRLSLAYTALGTGLGRRSEND